MSRMITLSGPDIPPVLRQYIDVSHVREVVLNENLASVSYMDTDFNVHHLMLDEAGVRGLRDALMSDTLMA